MNNLKQIIKFLFIKLLPIRRNRIVFMSYNGKICDSPFNVCSEMINRSEIDNKDIVYLVEKKYLGCMSLNINSVQINSLKGFYYYGTAEIIIDNNYGWKSQTLYEDNIKAKVIYKILKILKYKKNQKVYTFWHGTPIKRMERDQIGINVYDFECSNTTMILGNQYTLDIMRHLTFEKISMKLLGTPRNDILFKKDEKLKMKTKDKLGIPKEKKVILFAPSFRTDSSKNDNIDRSGINQLNEINFELLFETLKEKFDSDWVFVCRFHYHVSNMVDWDEIYEKYNGRVINGNRNDDMSEYLFCSDILVSDISSCLFDFMITERPSFIFFPDLFYYSSKERGLYFSLESLPFDVSTNFDEFIEIIKKFDEKKFQKRIKLLKQELGYVDSKNSTSIITDFIINDMKERRK